MCQKTGALDIGRVIKHCQAHIPIVDDFQRVGQLDFLGSDKIVEQVFAGGEVLYVLRQTSCFW